MLRESLLTLTSLALIVVIGAAMDGAALAADKMAIKIHNDSEVIRGLQLIDKVCDRTVFNDKLKVGQVKKFRVCKDDQGLAQIITVNWAGCSSAVKEDHADVTAGRVIVLPTPVPEEPDETASR